MKIQPNEQLPWFSVPLANLPQKVKKVKSRIEPFVTFVEPYVKAGSDYLDYLSDFGTATGLYTIPSSKKFKAAKRLLSKSKTKEKKMARAKKRKTNRTYKKKSKPKTKTGKTSGRYVSQGDSKDNFTYKRSTKPKKRVAPSLAKRIKKLESSLKKYAPNWSVAQHIRTKYYQMKIRSPNIKQAMEIPLFDKTRAAEIINTLTGADPTDDQKTELYNLGSYLTFTNFGEMSVTIRVAIFSCNTDTASSVLNVMAASMTDRGLTPDSVTSENNPTSYDINPRFMDLTGANLMVDPFNLPYISSEWKRRGKVTTYKVGPGDKVTFKYFKKKFVFNQENYFGTGYLKGLDDSLVFTIQGELGFYDADLNNQSSQCKHAYGAYRCGLEQVQFGRARRLDDVGSNDLTLVNGLETTTESTTPAVFVLNKPGVVTQYRYYNPS